MSRERELMNELDYLCLELDVARDNDYELMYEHIKCKMALVARELVKAGDFDPPRAETKAR